MARACVDSYDRAPRRLAAADPAFRDNPEREER